MFKGNLEIILYENYIKKKLYLLLFLMLKISRKSSKKLNDKNKKNIMVLYKIYGKHFSADRRLIYYYIHYMGKN